MLFRSGGLTGAPAFADTPTPTPTPTSTPAPTTATIDLRYAAADSTVTVTDPTTVGQAISQLGLKVDGDDRVQPGRSATVTNGMTLTIDVVSVTKTTKKQTVKYKTVKKKTKSMMKGKKKTVRKGRTGKVTITTTTTTVNGQTTTVVTSKKVNRKARSKIVKVGTSKLNQQSFLLNLTCSTNQNLHNEGLPNKSIAINFPHQDFIHK